MTAPAIATQQALLAAATAEAKQVREHLRAYHADGHVKHLDDARAANALVLRALKALEGTDAP